VAAAETGNADIHSADVRIFDRRGIWVSIQHAGVDLSPHNLAHDIPVALRANQGLTSAALKDRFAMLSDRHSNMAEIPSDPYDVSVDLAKRLTSNFVRKRRQTDTEATDHLRPGGEDGR
jgi:hypothetical protein